MTSRMSSVFQVVIVALTIALSVDPLDARSPNRAVGERFAGQVTRVVDGDTFWMRGANVRIRVWGLDAPELGDPGGEAATRALAGLIRDQTIECLVRDIDRFDRIVGQCWTSRKRDIAGWMIKSGHAREFCRFSRNHYGTC